MFLHSSPVVGTYVPKIVLAKMQSLALPHLLASSLSGIALSQALSHVQLSKVRARHIAFPCQFPDISISISLSSGPRTWSSSKWRTQRPEAARRLPATTTQLWKELVSPRWSDASKTLNESSFVQTSHVFNVFLSWIAKRYAWQPAWSEAMWATLASLMTSVAKLLLSLSFSVRVSVCQTRSAKVIQSFCSRKVEQCRGECRGAWHSYPTTHNEAGDKSGKENSASFLYPCDHQRITLLYTIVE